MLHAAPLTNGSKIGILHGAAQYVIQDKDGQIGSAESISAGLVTWNSLFLKIQKSKILQRVTKKH